ncbi:MULTISPECIES: acyl carrier protein [Streptomyces]|uniref:Acyl carrier protein n=2 Tax=Streptomyces achromogenes TaxID=67255 RepID=A0ABU0PS16_STRAH|nr:MULTISPECIES: acyl carrier protein [Streptomyces]MDQ0681171.1 acyl carrier protein [Streptomyces achromogenes]MDQ0956468.1 acyl carrier protein [Streptomyces sp. B4I13]
MMHAFEERIAKVLSTDFEITPDAVDSDVTLALLKFDSLTLVELALVLEKEFGITVEEGELTDTMTIGDTAALVAAKGTAVR